MPATSLLLSQRYALPGNDTPKSGQSFHASNMSCPGESARQVKILLVDDNVDLLSMSALLFEDKGFDVLTASSGKEALDILRQAPDVNVLFTDVVMAEMSGLQLACTVRDLYPRMKIVLVSGYPDLNGQASVNSLHEFDFVRKPYRIEEVIQLFDRRIDRQD